MRERAQFGAGGLDGASLGGAHAVVIGGGPAGAGAAIGLARTGWRTLLVERGEPGRDCCCGWCLSPRAGPTLERLGLGGVIDAVAATRTTGLRLWTIGGSAIDLPFASGAGWLTPRAALDDALRHAADRAGAIVLTATRATLSPADPGAVTLTRGDDSRTVRPALIVGADGLGSAVARAAGLAPRRGSAGRAYGFSFDCDAPPGAATLDTGRVEMALLRDGYIGMVAHAGGVHVAAMVRPAAGGRPEPPARVVRRACEAHPVVREALGGAPRLPSPIAAGPMPWRVESPAGRGVALVGDAGGYAEPFTGEGLAWAFESASLLADAAPTPGVFAADEIARYTRAWSVAIGRAQRRCAAVGSLLRRPVALAVAGRVAPGVTARAGRRIVRRVLRAGAPA